MNRLNRMAAAARHGAARLLPADRRDWAAALWAEAPEAPPGLARLAWRAGGAWMLARETLRPRRIGRAVLFAAAAAVAAWVAWPDSSARFATPGVRGYLIAMVLLLAGLPLLARPFLGPADSSRTARIVRAGTCAALLALMPAEAAVYQFAETPPRGGSDLMHRIHHGARIHHNLCREAGEARSLGATRDTEASPAPAGLPFG
jgi:hypothetical protein